MELFFGLLAAFLTVDVEAFRVALEILPACFPLDDAELDAALLVVPRSAAVFLATAFFTPDFFVPALRSVVVAAAFLVEAALPPVFFDAAFADAPDLVAVDFFAAFAPCAFLVGATVLLTMLVLSVPRTNAF